MGCLTLLPRLPGRFRHIQAAKRPNQIRFGYCWAAVGISGLQSGLLEGFGSTAL